MNDTDTTASSESSNPVPRTAMQIEGMYLLGMLFAVIRGGDTTREKVGTLPYVLNGKHDAAIMAAFESFEKDATLREQKLASLKEEIRNYIHMVFREATYADKQAQLIAQKEVKEELLKRNTPHVEGTVSELATKYGVSKSEIRRRKAEGTLDELLQGKSVQ